MQASNDLEGKLPISQVKSFTVNFQHLTLASTHNELLVLDNLYLHSIDVSHPQT